MASLNNVNTSPMDKDKSFALTREDVNGAIETLDTNAKKINDALPYIQCGTYQGDGQSSKEINLGFKPDAVMVWGTNGSQYDFGASGTTRNGGLALGEQPCSGYGDINAIEITTKGFKVSYYEGSKSDYYRNYVSTNSNGTHYYMAFKNIIRKDI